MNNQLNQRESFSGKIGIITAAAGSAIGLGNIWKFPYITGVYGGSAFILVYLICIAMIGIPVMLSEFAIGRKGQKNAVGSFKKIAPGTPWFFTGFLGVISAYVILSFYGVVAGWTLHYVFLALTNQFNGLTPDQIGNNFGAFTAQPILPLVWQVIFMIITAGVVVGGVKKGIERFSKILMPILLVIIIVLVFRSVTLKGAGKGLEFLLKPDFSKLTIPAILSALGHAFFSLSLGMGTMITYGSYIKKEENLAQTAVQVTIADTAIALLAGFAIFPAVFAFNIQPSAGPGLVFVTLPNVFNQMPMGNFFAVLFFILLAVAALTSSISILECVVAYTDEELGWNRKKSTIIVALTITILGAILSQGNGLLAWLKIPFLLGGNFEMMSIFDWFITLSDQLLPIGGFFIALFVGWGIKQHVIKDECTSNGKFSVSYYPVFNVLIKIVAPAAIALVFVSSIFGLFK